MVGQDGLSQNGYAVPNHFPSFRSWYTNVGLQTQIFMYQTKPPRPNRKHLSGPPPLETPVRSQNQIKWNLGALVELMPCERDGGIVLIGAFASDAGMLAARAPELFWSGETANSSIHFLQSSLHLHTCCSLNIKITHSCKVLNHLSRICHVSTSNHDFTNPVTDPVTDLIIHPWLEHWMRSGIICSPV